MTAPANERIFDPEASIVLVGIRGAGKRSLGFIGALHLRRRLVTHEHHFQQVTGLSQSQYLSKYGRDGFARRNVEVLKHMLGNNRTKCIIECGMSSLSEDAQAVLRLFSTTNPVVYVHREREQMLHFLDHADADQLLLADQTHRDCSNFEYYNLYDTFGGRSVNGSDSGTPSWENPASSVSRLLNTKEEFTRFLDLLRGQAWRRLWLESPFALNAIPLEFRSYSYALRLRLSYLVDMDLEYEDFEARGDCVELIIDHWPDDLLNVIAKHVGLIRRKLGVPIVYHVEKDPRGERKRTEEEKDIMDLALLEHGLRLNVDYISLDLERNYDLVTKILAHKGRSKVIGNFWNNKLGATPWADDSHVKEYQMAQSLGCDVVRMVRFCSGDSTEQDLANFKSKVEAAVPEPRPPLVAYDFSVLGARTPLQSRILAPVKHPDMETRRDHLATVCHSTSSYELLFRQFLLDPLQFYTIGANVSYSMMPVLHHAAYEFSGMPHTFQALQCNTLQELNQVCLNHVFGGATLAAPFKVAILPLLKTKSHHANAIGAVNVLLPLRGQSSVILDHANARNRAGQTSEFYGDNTDWLAIVNCVKRAISPRNLVQPSKTTGLIIGAGGMARAAIYALFQLGCRNIFVFNRTLQHAQEVAEHFNKWAATQQTAAAKGAGPIQICHVLESISQPWPLKYQPPTMIVSCVPATSVDGSPAADFEMPKQWLGSTTGGVVVEVWRFKCPSVKPTKLETS